MADLIRFVDSIASSPTLRLDLNDEVAFWVKKLDAPPPRLRRSVASNAMRDGINVGSASYDGRTLTLEMESRRSTQDAAATDLQKLWRELDRPNNLLMYQPNGLTKPVFFRTFRSDTSTIEDVMAQSAMRNFTVEILAEPFALGLKETLGPYTVNYNPASGTNPGYVDLPTILGDVASDFVYWDVSANTHQNRVIAVHSGTSAGVTGITTRVQIEGTFSTPGGADTANPGGGPDAAMSGTVTNNYLRTTFATAPTLIQRAYSTFPIQQPTGGRFRVIAAVRKSASSATVRVQMRDGITGVAGTIAGVNTSTNRQLVDLGVWAWSDATAAGVSSQLGSSQLTPQLYADRVGTPDALDWDSLSFIPAGNQADGSTVTMALVAPPVATIYSGNNEVVLDGITGQCYYTPTTTGDPTTTSGTRLAAGLSGGFPKVSPGLSNRLYVHAFRRDADGSSADAGVGLSIAVNLAYWPRYLTVRPVST